MIKNRFNYWTCSKFADFVRGEKKPFALEWGAWDKWTEKQKKKRPIRFWLSDTLLGYLQDIIYYPYDIYDSIRNYTINRFFDKTHYLSTGLKPGAYYDLDTRILYGLMNELAKFVEMDLAHLSKWCRTKKYSFKNGRCVEAAYDYFEWATNLTYNEEHGIYPDNPDYGKPTAQAEAAMEIKKIYEWWTQLRPKRADPYLTVSVKTHGDDYSNKIVYIQEIYHNEDNDMLKRLILLRRQLWI